MAGHLIESSGRSLSEPVKSFTSTLSNINLKKFENVLSQLWTWFLLGGIFLQIPFLIGPTNIFPVYKVYTIVALIIGIAVLIYFLAQILQKEMNFGITIIIQSHHLFILSVSGIGISVYSLLNMINQFYNFTSFMDYTCKDEISCAIFHILTFIFIYLQLFFFYNISGKKLSNNNVYKTMFIFLMTLNLLCLTTTATNEMKNQQSTPLRNGTHNTVTPTMATTAPLILEDTTTHTNRKLLAITLSNNIIAIQVFVAFALQYFLVAAYLMFNFCSQMNQPSQQQNDTIQPFTLQLLYQSVRRCHRCRKDEESGEIIPGPKISELIPIIKIFHMPSAIIIGSILSLIFLSINVYLDYNIMNDFDTITFLSTWYYKLYNISHIVNLLMIIICSLIAINNIRSINTFSIIQQRNCEETKVDKKFMIFAHCGIMCEILLTLYALCLSASSDYYVLSMNGIDYLLAIINAVVQTHFILCGLDLQVDNGLDLQVDKEGRLTKEQQIKIVQTLCKVSIINGMLNFTTAIVYYYETAINYTDFFNNQAYKGDTWNSLKLLLNPFIIFYRFYSSLCIFKIAIEFSNINAKSNYQSVITYPVSHTEDIVNSKVSENIQNPSSDTLQHIKNIYENDTKQ